jgi:hypothetical protein
MMKTSRTAEALAQHLRATYNLLESAFPQGIEADAYPALLAVLGENMSDRNLAEVIACAFGTDYERALNDVYRARSTSIPSPKAMEKLKERLILYGYEDWVRGQ